MATDDGNDHSLQYRWLGTYAAYKHGHRASRSRSLPIRQGAEGDAIVGAACTTSLLAPGPPVIAPARGWSDDAPPGGQPGTDSLAEDMEPPARSRSSTNKDGEPTRSKSTPSRHGARGDAIVGAVCTTSLSAPGSPVITSARSWSDDAPPGERPGRSSHIKVLEPRTKSWSNNSKDDEPKGLRAHMELQEVNADRTKPDDVHNDVMVPRCIAEARGARSTSVDHKCKGKYRIRVKSSACGCCRGT